MIITVWEIEDERYFTLSFTSTGMVDRSMQNPTSNAKQVVTSKRHVHRTDVGGQRSESGSGSSGGRTHSNPSSISSGRSSRAANSSSTSAMTSPRTASMSGSPFPPMGPPQKIVNSTSTLQKAIILKDALMDNTDVAIIAMWKDESLAIPNKAARRLFQNPDLSDVRDGHDMLSKYCLYNEDFTKKLDFWEYPISVLVRGQAPVRMKIGLYHPEHGGKVDLDCSGEAIIDENGEFLGGILTCKDITSVNEEITEIKESNEQRFQLICDSLPQMLWTTNPEGMHEWFSQRW